MVRDSEIFQNLFVLEAANNHWGDLERGKKIIRDYSTVVRQNNVKAAIKFQFRDVDNFIHSDYKGNEDIRYIKKTEATKMAPEDYKVLGEAVRRSGCIPMATAFDEMSVDLCANLGFPIFKVASSDINDWPLLERIAHYKLPTIVSTGGASEQAIDQVVLFFEHRDIPLAINHCVSLYPSEDSELELYQISYLRKRYSNHVIGFSTHEKTSWDVSMHISYALGARTWERHIDIDYEGVPVSSYCSLPHQIDEWFKAFHKTREMLGTSTSIRRTIPKAEIEYLDALVRGVYAKRDLPAGYVFDNETFSRDFQLAVPLRKGQISTREVVNGVELVSAVRAGEPVHIESINSPYAENENLKQIIKNRGV
jgi:sialic acid synthase SpsE